MTAACVQIAALGKTPLAIVDVETTGLYPERYDRIVEVAVVRLTPEGSLEDEFTTLVNPGRDVGPSDIHGITASDVVHAPSFDGVAGDIAHRLAGAVVVGHNVGFDLRFLAAEFSRLGATMPPVPRLCTVRLAYRFLADAPSWRLEHCCEAAGVPLEYAHHALGDARATAALTVFLLDAARQQGALDLEDVGCRPLEVPTPEWIAWPARGHCWKRDAAARRTAEERKYLARLIERLPAVNPANADHAVYLDLLDRALQDRLVTPEEGHRLLAVAAAEGLSPGDIRLAHDAYVRALVAAAVQDGVVTPAEQRDLFAVAEMLGVTEQRVEAFLAAPPEAPRAPAMRRKLPSGTRVCFTGTLMSRIDGETISRDVAVTLAQAAGLTVLSSVTKKLDVLVVADPKTVSAKAKKARDYGTTIMAEAAFWQAIGIQVE